MSSVQIDVESSAGRLFSAADNVPDPNAAMNLDEWSIHTDYYERRDIFGGPKRADILIRHKDIRYIACSALIALSNDATLIGAVNSIESTLMDVTQDPRVKVDLSLNLSEDTIFGDGTTYTVPRISFTFEYRLPFGIWTVPRITQGNISFMDKVNFSQLPAAFYHCDQALPILSDIDPEEDAAGDTLSELSGPFVLRYTTFKRSKEVRDVKLFTPSILKFSMVKKDQRPLNLALAALDISYRPGIFSSPDGQAYPPFPISRISYQFMTQNLYARAFTVLMCYLRLHNQLLNIDLANSL